MHPPALASLRRLDDRLGILDRNEWIGVAVDHSPRALLISINVRDAQGDRDQAVDAAQSGLAALDPDGVSEIATHVAGDVLNCHLTADEASRRPRVAWLQLTPATFPRPPAAEQRCIVGMRTNLRPRSDVAVDERLRE